MSFFLILIFFFQFILDKFLLSSDTIKTCNFFSSFKKTSVAIDDSGSTEGEIMKNQKEIITKILKDTNCEKLLDIILCWDNICTVNSINDIRSDGLTEPSCIFKKLGNDIINLLITTDGEIDEEEVKKTNKIIKDFKNLKNIICLLFQDDVKFPSELNISVFYPFFEQCKRENGAFYLFYFLNKRLYLLLKNDPLINKNKLFKDPPKVYDENTKWEQIPSFDYEDIKKIEVTMADKVEGNLLISEKKQILQLPLLEKEILKEKYENSYSLVCSKDFNAYMKGNIELIINACVKSYNSENFNTLRNIISEWKRGLLLNI